MDTLAPNLSICRHASIRLNTQHATEFIDLTDRLEALVLRTRIDCGFVNVQTLHTTTAIVVNELEPLLLDDFTSLLEAAAPADLAYRHDDASIRTVNVTPNERVNGHAHCRALLLGSFVCLNVIDGRLQLGRWQRVLMAELDGPRSRDLSVVIVGEARR
jgi:secondary thiamine-phosphate synthase enzyme